MKTIVFATKNEGKVREVKKIFDDPELDFKTLKEFPSIPDIPEDGDTFEANAKIKAKAVFEIVKLPVMADDSGLAVDQLDGAPGVYSARYSGEGATDESNNEKLLKELSTYSQPHKARFICAAVFYDGNEFITTNGEVHGQIIHNPSGENGFGYDPLFLPDGFTITSGEMTLDEKNKISHRAKAFKQLKAFMAKKL